MKTIPMQHQRDGLAWSEGRRYYGLFWEQGTGKTWALLADAERAFAANKINGLCVVAPKGVHTNWTRRELPTHLSAPYKAAAYRAGSVGALRACQALHVEGGDKLRVLSINIDALNHKEGFSVARRFLEEHRAILVMDESHRIKTPTTGVTKRSITLARLSVARRIASGTPLANAPPDLYSQFEFMKPGLLGTDSYRAFVARYCELMPDDAGIMRHIVKRMKEKEWARKAAERGELELPQIFRKGRDGTPIWKNLDELRRIIAPHTSRILKKDCLDLPEKIYKVLYFELSAQQQRVYKQVETELTLEVGEDLLAVNALSARTKLRQITSGFVLVEGVAHYVAEENPRLALLKETLLDQQGQVIIWAHFREEIAAIMRLLKEMEISAAEYHGDVSDRNRDIAVDGFQSGEFQIFVGQEQAGGTGLTLTAAQTVIYVSTDFNYVNRAQSEDRAHRKGTIGHVLYIDLVAIDTVDEPIANALQRKEDTAAYVLGDR